MPTSMKKLLAQLSRSDLEKLLAAKSEVESLEARRAELLKELAAVEKKLARLADVALGARKTTRKKAARKATRKTAKKTTRKRVAKKAGKKVARKTTKKGRPKLEDVVVKLLEKKGEPMSFQDLLATIVKRKLFATRSSKFDNVLRRTLSTSKRVKRVSRGVYGL